MTTESTSASGAPGLSLNGSLRVQFRVIGALLMREILTRYGRHNIGFLWLFVEPMIFTIGITTFWNLAKAVHGSNLPITAFAVTGYSTVLLWRNMPARCIAAVHPNLSLMYHRNVKVIDIYLSRLILEGAGATISFVTLTLIFSFVGWMRLPEDLLLVALGWVMTAWFGFSLALVLGALSEMSDLVEKLWHPAAYLLFPLSGAAFLVNSLPKVMQELVLFLPMVHGVETVREGFFGSQIKAHYSLSYMAICNAALMLVGLLLVRKTSRMVTPE